MVDASNGTRENIEERAFLCEIDLNTSNHSTDGSSYRLRNDRHLLERPRNVVFLGPVNRGAERKVDAEYPYI